MYIINISIYKKEQLKYCIYQFLVGRGGGGKNILLQSPIFSCNARNQYFLGRILVKSTTNLINNFPKCSQNRNRYIVHFFSITMGRGEVGETNPVRSTISDQSS